MGHSVKRKEDPRFIRGAGEFIEDLVLPGMLWMDIVRSPYAHANIRSIDTSAHVYASIEVDFEAVVGQGDALGARPRADAELGVLALWKAGDDDEQTGPNRAGDAGKRVGKH